MQVGGEYLVVTMTVKTLASESASILDANVTNY